MTNNAGGSISTAGDNSIGIFAQSIGGGGGSGGVGIGGNVNGSASSSSTQLAIALGGSGGTGGAGGAVSVSNAAAIQTGTSAWRRFVLGARERYGECQRLDHGVRHRR